MSCLSRTIGNARFALVASAFVTLFAVSTAQARYADGMNLYQYVRSSPVSYVDPTGEASRIVSARSDMSVDAKQEWVWRDEVRKPGASCNFPWSKAWEDQDADFMVSLKTNYTINIGVAGHKGPRLIRGGPAPSDSATVVTLRFSTQNYVLPRSRIIGPAVRGRAFLDDALNGKLCRKAVYVKQTCCIESDEYDSAWDRVVGNPSGTSRADEGRYVRVYMYGHLELPENTIPWIARCNVDRAEGQLQKQIDKLNDQKHSMCTGGLDLSGQTDLDTDGKLRKSLPSGTVVYAKGSHNPVVIFERSRYILHPSPR